MKAAIITKIAWDEGEKDRLVWKFSENTITWDSTMIVKANQAMGLLTGHEHFSRKLNLHDIFASIGEFVLKPSMIPLLVEEFPGIVTKGHFSCNVVYCSTREHQYATRISKKDSFHSGWVQAEADARCKFKITDVGRFFKNVVANHKKTSNDKALSYLDKCFGDELFRCNSPYNLPPKQKIPLVDVWKNIGIELIDLKFDNYEQSSGGAGA